MIICDAGVIHDHHKGRHEGCELGRSEGSIRADASEPLEGALIFWQKVVNFLFQFALMRVSPSRLVARQVAELLA